jgi:hypothetical protein
MEVSEVSDDERADDSEKQAEEPAEQEPSEEPAVEEEPTAEAAEAGAEAEAPPLEMDVFDLLRLSAVSFAQEAWCSLGIRLRPGAQEVEADLRCARVAIDTVELLLKQLTDELEPQERQAFDAELTNLRINFVRLTGSEKR